MCAGVYTLIASFFCSENTKCARQRDRMGAREQKDAHGGWGVEVGGGLSTVMTRCQMPPLVKSDPVRPAIV